MTVVRAAVRTRILRTDQLLSVRTVAWSAPFERGGLTCEVETSREAELSLEGLLIGLELVVEIRGF
ncbi:hypothetical protein Atai01_06270 [Amycolatopsis taiwanensis]|uniref:Uncharacterized protein n=1 Tax=Amycolatopsis taiwanensis TaxID=342230 RepID=A0A9W6QUK3_9PSEU|nr:hypothetical protein Atai01_06270 [Amycolatopsis taiwanensis]